MKNFFKLFGVIAIVAITGIGLAGCDDGSGKNDNSPPPSKTIAVTGDVAAKTLTFTINGAEWDSSGFNDYWYELAYAVCTNTGTGDITNSVDVSETYSLSADKKVISTVSKKGSKTGTITFTPRTSVSVSSYLTTATQTNDEFTVTGDPVTFTIE